MARSCIRGPLYPPLPVDSERIDEDTGWNGGVGTTCRRHGLDLMVVAAGEVLVNGMVVAVAGASG